MAYFTTLRFIEKHGRKKLLWLIEARRRGITERAIAEELGLSKARVCQICRRIFRVVYLLEAGTAEALRFHANADKREIEEIERVIHVDPISLLGDRQN